MRSETFVTLTQMSQPIPKQTGQEGNSREEGSGKKIFLSAGGRKCTDSRKRTWQTSGYMKWSQQIESSVKESWVYEWRTSMDEKGWRSLERKNSSAAAWDLNLNITEYLLLTCGSLNKLSSERIFVPCTEWLLCDKCFSGGVLSNHRTQIWKSLWERLTHKPCQFGQA